MKLKRNKLLMPIVTRLELLSSCLWKHTCKLLFLVGFATHKHTRVITAACRIRTRSYDHTWQCDYLIAIIDDKLIISSCHLNGNIMRDRTEGGFANCTYPWKPLATPWKPVILNDCTLDCYSKWHSRAFKILITALIWSILHLQEAVQLDGAIFGGLLEKTLPHVAKHMVRLPS